MPEDEEPDAENCLGTEFPQMSMRVRCLNTSQHHAFSKADFKA